MARRQQEKSAQTRTELLQAALRLFTEKGFEATSVDEITRSAGYAKGSFYRHWLSKDALFVDFMEERMHRHWLMLDTAVAEVKTAKELVAVALGLMEHATNDDHWTPIYLEFMAHAARNAVVRERMRAMYEAWGEVLRARLTHLLGQRALFSAGAAAGLVIALFDGYNLQVLTGSKLMELADIEKAIHLIIGS